MHTDQKQQGIDQYAERLIRFKARQLVGTAGIQKADIPDIEQELRLELILRLPKFDESKATHNTFVSRIIDGKISKLIRHRAQQIRDFRRESCSLNDLIKDEEGNTIQRGYTMAADAARRHTRQDDRSPEALAELRMDVSRQIAGLPEDLSNLAQGVTFSHCINLLLVPRFRRRLCY